MTGTPSRAADPIADMLGRVHAHGGRPIGPDDIRASLAAGWDPDVPVDGVCDGIENSMLEIMCHERSAAGESCVRLLLEAGADPDAGRCPPVIVAIRTGQPHMAHVLLDAGADPDRPEAIGGRPLHHVASSGGDAGMVVVAERLWAMGARPERDTEGRDPLLAGIIASDGILLPWLWDRGMVDRPTDITVLADGRRDQNLLDIVHGADRIATVDPWPERTKAIARVVGWIAGMEIADGRAADPPVIPSDLRAGTVAMAAVAASRPWSMRLLAACGGTTP